MRHGYKNGCDITYQRDSKGNWQILWMCKKSKAVIETTTIERETHD